MPEKYAFELKAGATACRTAVNGRLREFTKDNTPYTAKNEQEAEALRGVDGLEEVSTSKKGT